MQAQWNRSTLPTYADADEFDNILVMYATGNKAVYNWEDYVDDGMQDEGCAWMHLPETDFPEDESEATL